MIGGCIRLAAWALPALLAAASTAQAVPSHQQLVVDLSEHEVGVAVNYAGADLVLFGTAEGTGNVVVEVRGPLRSEVVRKKQRIAGIWLNHDEVVFRRVPAFYAVASSALLDKILSAKEQAEEHIGPENLWLVPPSGVTAEQIRIFRAALIRAKQDEELFPVKPTPVRFLGGRLFRANIHFPADAPVGSYQVNVLLVKGGKIVKSAQTPLILSRVGFEARVFELAHTRSLSYGIVATVIAVMAGWLASVFFRSKA